MTTGNAEHEFSNLINSDGWPSDLPFPILSGRKGTGYEHKVMRDKKKFYLLDFAWPRFKVALEIEGGTWTRGGHAGMGKLPREHDRRNWLTLNGWLVIYCAPERVGEVELLENIKTALQRQGWKE